MKFATQAAIVAVCAAFFVAPAASAANLNDCIQINKKATEALNTAQPGDSTEAAKAQVMAGRTYCGSSMYAQGVARYAKALQLLGKG